jgi:small-conductance mechanosensitive channel
MYRDMLWNLGPRIAWTLAALGGGYLVGLLLNSILVPRLVRLAARTRGQWDDLVINELKKRLPFWSLLGGAWIAAGLWNVDPDIQHLIERVIFVAAAFSATLAVSAVATGLVGLYGSSVPDMQVTGLTNSIVNILVLGLGLLVILNSLGVSITPMLTALGVGGLAVALALQDPLSNMFAGVFLTISGQIRVGDYVRLDNNLEGYVVDFSWRSARVRQLANNVVVVPNAKLAQSMVLNFSLPSQDLAVLVDLGVAYDSDLDQVERVTIEVATDVMQTVPGGVKDFAPFIRFHTFADSSINFSTIMRGNEFVDQFLIKHEFVKRLQKRYAQEGINIPFPIRTVMVPKGVDLRHTPAPPAEPPA